MHWPLLKRSLQSVGRIGQSFPVNVRSISAPNHMRARNNKIYYEKIIRNRTLTEEQQQQRHSDSKFRETIDRTSVPMRRKEKTYRISNERPDDLFEEREIYEQLCRQNGSVVRWHERPVVLSKILCSRWMPRVKPHCSVVTVTTIIRIWSYSQWKKNNYSTGQPSSCFTTSLVMQTSTKSKHWHRRE